MSRDKIVTCNSKRWSVLHRPQETKNIREINEKGRAKTFADDIYHWACGETWIFYGRKTKWQCFDTGNFEIQIHEMKSLCEIDNIKISTLQIEKRECEKKRHKAKQENDTFVTCGVHISIINSIFWRKFFVCHFRIISLCEPWTLATCRYRDHTQQKQKL